MTTPATETAPSSPAEYEGAVGRAREAAAAYYGDGGSPLDDASYDELLRAIEAWEKDHPEHVAADSPTGKVGAGAAPVGDIAHTTRLLSLDNAFSPENLLSWGASVARRLGRPVTGGWAIDLKLDGAAIAARYRAGRLERIITRGNGTHGEDVSHVIGTIVGLPTRLDAPLTVEVRGEVLFSHEQFEDANRVRAEHGAKLFPNPRNATSGTLRAKNRPYELPMTFFAYGAVELEAETFLPDGATHAEILQAVADAGVQTTADTPAGLHVFTTLAEVQQQVDVIAARRPSLPFDIDGAVIRANDTAEQSAVGVGSRFPHWAIAYKYPAVERMTTLKRVTWEVGRTGVIAPTAELEPVEVGGTIVTRATLHNPADIRRRDLRLGDHVTVRRAGDVIPQVQAPVVALRPGGAEPVPLPEVCPNCGGEINKAKERWRCAKGSACRLPALIEYAAGRDQLDIEGLGTRYVKALVESGAVSDIGDLFTLTVEQLSAASGSDKRGAKLAEQIAAAKSLPLNRIFCALGILGTGRSMSRRIAAYFRTMDAIRAADADALRWVEGIGPEKAPVVVEQVADMAPVIAKLVAAGVNMEEPEQDTESSDEGPLAGKTVVVTGKMTDVLDGYGRNEMNELIEKAGGRAGSSVNSKTDYLVAAETGGKPSTKAVKAAALGVTVLTPGAFAELVADFIG
ncbi:NAD-dependent DNA ligase LigA [Streptomyces prunicolor]|uniref:NAD-dependent DNA ligase LigA n=1 Tax=Streptomyces prunicolor TaxID=67348 RepID=UPI00036291E2|nr:NAD-dependent DNA ligase LigA [Streptomyces prunicolor]